jgi:putative N6-adenine-specific DNA methylase
MPVRFPSEAARKRALKRHVWSERHRFLATCAVGVEDLLEVEVGALDGVEALTVRTGGVGFTAPFDALLSGLLQLRVAESLRVYLLEDFAAATFPMLYDQLGRVRWPLWLPDVLDATVRIKTTKSRLRDHVALERSLRSALHAHGIDAAKPGGPRLTLHLHLHHDRASVSLDASGPLHQRHGDKWVSRTTIRETTAAALCAFVGSERYDLVLDPFCGSGTLVIEAAERAHGEAAGRRRTFPFEATPAWKPERFAHARRLVGADAAGHADGHDPVRPTPTGPAAEEPARARPPQRILASDADPEAVRVCHRNLQAWGVADDVTLTRARAQTLDLAAIAREHGATRPLLLANPPYGKAAGALGAPPAELIGQVLAGAGGWTFALLYPVPDDVAGIAGVRDLQVRPIITGGLRNAMIVGSVTPPD